MAELQIPIETLRQRLNGLLADWGAEFSLVLKELEEKRARLAELDAGAGARARELEALNKRIEGQDALIETLRADAEEASRLRRDVHAKDAEIERLNGEVGSQQNLIQTMRSEAAEVQRLREDLALMDRQVRRHERARRDAEARAEEISRALEDLRATQGKEKDERGSELEALRAELEARKALIRTLRADAQRARALEARLEERREAVEKLEASVNRYADTIIELKSEVERWKDPYASSRPGHAVADTAPPYGIVEVGEAQVVEDGHGGEQTMTIDMRKPLMEARRSAERTMSAPPKHRAAKD